MTANRVFLVDDHPIMLSGVRFLIEQEPDLSVVGSAATAAGAMTEISRTNPTLAIVDISLPSVSGIVLISWLARDYPNVLCIALTAHEEPGYVRQALSAGAKGFVVKRAAATDLLSAIRTIVSGDTYIDPGLAGRIISSTCAGLGDPKSLSERETVVSKFVARGFSNKEISSRLQVSIKTVETYRLRATEKLGIHSRAALVRYAHENGWLAEDW